MHRKSIAIAVAALGLSGTAAAQEPGLYAGGGYQFYDIEPTVDLGAVIGTVGYDFNEYVAVEGFLNTGLDDDDGVELEIGYGFSVLGSLPVNEQLSLYARGGWAEYELEGGGVSADEDDLNFGFGARVFTDIGEIRAEWSRAFDKDNIEANAISWFCKIFPIQTPFRVRLRTG